MSETHHIAACTIVARNYLPYARVLAESFRAHHEGPFYTFVLDPDDAVREADWPFELLAPLDVLDTDEWDTMRSLYSIMELATAVKPFVLSHLLQVAGPTVFYIDPDIWIMDSIDHLAEFALDTGIVLTPHLVSPLPDDGSTPTPTYILQSGVYNLGFLGVSDAAKPFLEWWSERLRRDCVVDPANGLFVDQRWVDLAPGMFPHTIVPDPALNIAYWNLGNRSISHDGDRYLVEGAPIRFVHLSGYDPDRDWLLSKHQGARPRTLLSEHPDIARLCSEYGEMLRDAGYDKAKELAFTGHELDDGTALDGTMRHAYRLALLDFERPETRDRWSSGDRPPNPFADAEQFWQWLAEPADAPVPQWVNRYLWALYVKRSDLQAAFPDLGRSGGAGYRNWLVNRAVHDEDLPRRMLPSMDAIEHVVASPIASGGVNVVGYLKAELGVGEAARNVVHALDANEMPIATLSYDRTISRQDHEFDERGWIDGFCNPYDLTISCVNADVLPDLIVDLGVEYFADRYHVGYWAWELDEFPVSWYRSIELVDEIWMNSMFAASGLRKLTDKPVHAFPIPVLTPTSSAASKADLGLPEDAFLFLFIFDYLSVFERKNPVAVVDAFASAFAPGEGPVLVLKTVNAHQRPLDAERLRMAASQRTDILIIEDYLSAPDKNALMQHADAYVSLHRSEGFGLTLAEAMAMGKPTIGTRYSGNLEFMDRSNSFLVDYTLTDVPAGAGPYREGAVWAEPSVEHAAQLMRRVMERPEEAAATGTRAAQDISERHGPEARAKLLASHLERIENVGERTANLSGFGSLARMSTQYTSRQASAAVRAPVTNAWFGVTPGGAKRSARDAAFRLTEPATRQLQERDQLLLDYIESLHAEVQAMREELARDVGGDDDNDD